MQKNIYFTMFSIIIITIIISIISIISTSKICYIELPCMWNFMMFQSSV